MKYSTVQCTIFNIEISNNFSVALPRSKLYRHGLEKLLALLSGAANHSPIASNGAPTNHTNDFGVARHRRSGGARGFRQGPCLPGIKA